nr:integrase, catalytic core [Tanacetum cinerariifolium]
MAADNNKKNKGNRPDVNSPFYLHPSDYPRTMHVNDALTDNNYRATEHMTNITYILEDVISSNNKEPVTIPNREVVPIKGRGNHILPNETKMKGILHILNFNCNLLSVSKLSCDLSCVVSFFMDFFIMQDLALRNLIGAGRCKNGLYRMGMLGMKRKALMSKVDIWHKRLGHASGEKLNQISFLRNISFKNKDRICDSCAKSKLTRQPFPTSVTKTNACFDLLHCDIWGKYRTPSFLKAVYFLTIVGDYSRAEEVGENNDEIPYDVGEIQIETSEIIIESTDEEGSNDDRSSIDSANEGERQHVEEINVDTEVGAFLVAIASNDEPKSFNQAVHDLNWRATMQKEIEALEENETWSIKELPSGKKPIDSKWVYKIKYKPSGEIERYKARLVANVKRDWIVRQLDVNNAFLHGELNEEVDMKISEGYEKGGTGSESRPPMLNKENYVPWSSRLLRYAKSRPNGKLIHNSILNGPYVRKMIPEPDIYAAVDSCETAQKIWLRVQQMMKGSDIGIQEKKAKLFNKWERTRSNHSAGPDIVTKEGTDLVTWKEPI